MSNETNEKYCLNCGHPVQLNYCENCGQETVTRKIDWKFCTKDLLFNNFTLHNKMLFTLKSLLLNPKKMINEYISGKRVFYSGAIQLLFFVMILNGLIYVLLGKPAASAKTLLEINAMQQKINLMEYTKTLILMYVLMSSLGSRIVYAKHKYTIPEHIIINFYIISFSWFVSGIVKLISWNHLSSGYVWISFLLILLYYIRIFYTNTSLIKNIFKAFLNVFIILLFSLIMILTGAIIAGIYYQLIR